MWPHCPSSRVAGPGERGGSANREKPSAPGATDAARYHHALFCCFGFHSTVPPDTAGDDAVGSGVVVVSSCSSESGTC